MEKSLNKTIEEFGERVASAWQGMRPTTKRLVERALQTSLTAIPYDARAEWELCRLLAALEDRAKEAKGNLNAEQIEALMRMADACAAILHTQARSAESFELLFTRALRAKDFKKVDELADSLLTRLALSEISELARSNNVMIRAIAFETLAQAPTSALVQLLNDPVDAGVARIALYIQAEEYGSEEARWVIEAIEEAAEVELDS
ncbi:MAG: hypothetical protein IRZ19_04490 [Pyrinomonas methylaliphatogenes]|jgi:hypothetical protein|uniref:Uncharacterized protein n=1 Tax=Pyrinomonas methylaliphatogenes TaxID=454194 RepID=A0A0B6WTW8_9BACT|nr:hypothetical protein [Pyrinomonas methylaliphatogenes]CDM64668.1 hypothetical protein PYK22_00663 [Pyrinomonas methylaliphatogenes]